MIIDLVQESCNKFQIVWIPGYSGVEGSERSDVLARQAASRDEVDIALPVSFGENKKKIERYIQRQQQMNWSAGKNKYYNMRPTIEYHCQYSHKSRKKDVTITRLRLGRCGLNHYLHVMKPRRLL